MPPVDPEQDEGQSSMCLYFLSRKKKTPPSSPTSPDRKGKKIKKSRSMEEVDIKTTEGMCDCDEHVRVYHKKNDGQ